MKFVASLLVIFFGATSFAADPAKMTPEQQEMMKKYHEFATPGAQHKVLESMVGNWKFSSKAWHSANAKAEESTGTATLKMILGGRWLQGDYTGKAMGMDYVGFGLIGYDNVKGKYETMYMSNMSTGVIYGSGDFNESKKTLSDSGTFTCPLSADKAREYRGEWKIVNKDKMIYSMWAPGIKGEKEFKNMEMTLTRAK